jgi:hypothetical protein
VEQHLWCSTKPIREIAVTPDRDPESPSQLPQDRRWRRHQQLVAHDPLPMRGIIALSLVRVGGRPLIEFL